MHTGNTPLSCHPKFLTAEQVKADLLQNANTIAKKINKLDFQTCHGLPETKSINSTKGLMLPTLGVF